MPHNLFIALTLIPLFLSIGCSTPKITFSSHSNMEQRQNILNAFYHLPSAFEKNDPPQTSWEQEEYLGIEFAKQRDYYRALTCLKKAIFLIPQREKKPLIQQRLFYEQMLVYYLAEKHEQAIAIFDHNLKGIQTSFPASKEVLLILYDCYQHMGNIQAVKQVQQQLHLMDKQAATSSQLYQAIKQENSDEIKKLSKKNTSWETLPKYVDIAKEHQKSPFKAKLYNALLPGSGYAYLGQKQTAVTTFLLNSLCIIASYQAFSHNHPALGILLGSFELGWYIGSIHGAGLAAQNYNKHIYKPYADRMIKENKLTPLLQFNYAF